MKVHELGEFGLIDLLARSIPPSPHPLILGIGDDAAAWQGAGGVELATIDALFENVHFSLDTISWWDLGWKALAVNLSDIAAMGGEPKYALVSLAVPPDTEAENLVELYKGMGELAEKFGVAICGGNVSYAPLATITIAVFGTQANGKPLLKRSSAKAGDKIAVTGYLGLAAAGLQILHDKSYDNALSCPRAKEAFLRPSPRIDEAKKLGECGVLAAIDISDGLVADLRHICQASGVAAKVNVGDILLHQEITAMFPEKAIQLALSGGEDYELLFTAGEQVIKAASQGLGYPVTVIGKIIEGESGEVSLLDAAGKPFQIIKEGWDHFSHKKL